MAMRMDLEYEKISRRFHKNPDEFADAFKNMTKTIHEAGGTVALQLVHAGGQTDSTGDFGFYAGGASIGDLVWDDTNGMRNLNNLLPAGSGWTLTRATDINNDGFITGFGTNGSGDVRAFLLTPTCAAGGGGSFSRWRRTQAPRSTGLLTMPSLPMA